MTHTPAPWTLNPARSTRVDLIDNPKGEAVGEVVWVDVRNPADAQLIVAAPDLLDALILLRKELHQSRKLEVKKDYSLMVADAAASAAIQKAQGVAA